MKSRVNLDLVLDSCLRDLEQGADMEECLRRYPEWRAELEPALRAALRLWNAPRVEPSAGATERIWADVAAGIRSSQQPGVTKRLLGRYQGQKRPRDWSQPQRRYSMSGIAAAVALAITLMGGGMAYASQDALPGQALYQVRGVVESARVQLSANEQARLELWLELADRRLADAEWAATEYGGTGVEQCLDAYSDHLDHAWQVAEGFRGRPEEEQVRAHVLERIRAHVPILERLQERLHDRGHAAEALGRAIENAHRLEERWGQHHQEGDADHAGPEGHDRDGSGSGSAPAATAAPTVTAPTPNREQHHDDPAPTAHVPEPEHEREHSAASGVAPAPTEGQQGDQQHDQAQEHRQDTQDRAQDHPPEPAHPEQQDHQPEPAHPEQQGHQDDHQPAAPSGHDREGHSGGHH